MIAMMSRKYPCTILRHLMLVLVAGAVVLAIARWDLRKEILDKRVDLANRTVPAAPHN